MTVNRNHLAQLKEERESLQDTIGLFEAGAIIETDDGRQLKADPKETQDRLVAHRKKVADLDARIAAIEAEQP
jgi:hypothetical protein